MQSGGCQTTVCYYGFSFPIILCEVKVCDIKARKKSLQLIHKFPSYPASLLGTTHVSKAMRVFVLAGLGL